MQLVSSYIKKYEQATLSEALRYMLKSRLVSWDVNIWLKSGHCAKYRKLDSQKLS